MNYLPTAVVATALLCATLILIRKFIKDRKEDESNHRLSFKTHYSVLEEEIEGLYSMEHLSSIPDIHDQILDLSNTYVNKIKEAREKTLHLQHLLIGKEKSIREKNKKEVPTKGYLI